MCSLSGSHYILIMIKTIYDFRNVRAWIYLKVDERSSSSILRKWFLGKELEDRSSTLSFSSDVNEQQRHYGRPRKYSFGWSEKTNVAKKFDNLTIAFHVRSSANCTPAGPTMSTWYDFKYKMTRTLSRTAQHQNITKAKEPSQQWAEKKRTAINDGSN